MVRVRDKEKEKRMLIFQFYKRIEGKSSKKVRLEQLPNSVFLVFFYNDEDDNGFK